MNKKTLIALAVFGGLLGLVIFLQSRPEEGVRVGERPRPLPSLKGKAIDKVSITSKGKTVVLNKEGEKEKAKWSLVQPVSYPADKYSADTVVEKLQGLEFGDLVTEQKARHAGYDLSGDEAIHVVAEAAGKKVADLYLGKVLEDFTMFRMANKDEVWQAVGALRHAFEREVSNWRDRNVISFKQEEARKLIVTTEAGTIKLKRKDEKAAWQVEESPVELAAMDNTTANNLLSSLYSLSAHAFADTLTAQKAGVDQPRATITAVTTDGKEHTLLVGNSEKDDHWVQRKGAAQIFVLKQHTMDSLVKRPLDFRDKTVLSFKADDMVTLKLDNRKEKTAVTLQRKGDDWLGDGKKVGDTTKIKEAAEALASLNAEGFAWRDRKALGLDTPDWVVEITLKDRTTYTLKVGGVEKDGMVGVARVGMPELFTARKYALERFLLDPKNYK